ncbi:MAG: arginine--tRNA ligase [Candidatus Omnitrophica bacterium]|nr:arginine--tRNA ligase [Candidatus Omnitrophota bacterium]MDD5310772.1 arginine--tRNA ligase [Candidatus Omnitrophota bacterium]MDD5545545.1 arginine--tRNA ligase [Candidatus Omnitrophota bacterium]
MIETRILEFLDKNLGAAEKIKGLYARDLLCLENPKDPAHGDISTNIAFRLAKPLKVNPADLAKEIAKALTGALASSPLKGEVDAIEPLNGFINIRLSAQALRQILKDIKSGKEKFGCNDSGKGKKIQVEFVSANPTGSLSVAHARQAAFGDSLANIIRANGHEVTREYYINDEGVQITILGQSIYARYRQEIGDQYELPENGYKGEYIKEMAEEFRKEHGDKYKAGTPEDLKVFSEWGCDYLLKEIKQELLDFGVLFDVWFSQKALGASGKIEKTLSLLREKGLLYEAEGALWFKSTQFGDDKDRVVKKSDGTYTYVTPDIAYHKDKFERGFSRVIDILGPDHHGYINRIKAAVQALGYPACAVSIIIIQLATLYKNGQPVKMSTRAGEYITLREVLDEVGKDAARFFFLMRKANAHLDFDLELAKKQTPENPVYYVQYAHARICSILALSKLPDGDIAGADLKLLGAPEELNLFKELRQFPQSVKLAAQELDPYRIITYLQELAACFHKFYEANKVISDDAELSRARIYLVSCVKQALANGLTLLGVSCPAKM